MARRQRAIRPDARRQGQTCQRGAEENARERAGAETCGPEQERVAEQAAETIRPLTPRRGRRDAMHKCSNCGQACDCDGDDTWNVMSDEWYYFHCDCECYDDEDDFDDEDFDE
jgi:hypothetical protein